MSEKEYTCKDCKFYNPVSDTEGDCFGHTVPADMSVSQCPANAFELKK